MKVTVRSPRELGDDWVARWRAILASTPALGSPYFAPEFTRIVAEVRDDVEVAALSDGAELLGFFPYQRGPGDVGHPVGGAFSDFQAVVAPDSVDWDARALVRGCGLAAWRFDHLLASQRQLAEFHWGAVPSPYVDLSRGFDAWVAERKGAGSKIDAIRYEIRKAERRLGPVRFELHTTDHRVFKALLEWKSQQLVETGARNLLWLPWVGRLLDRIRHAEGDGFAGVLSALYVGDTLAAAHLGMRTETVMHYWLPAYGKDLATLSPGNILFLELVKACAARGVRRVDLGKGPEAYKQRMTSVSEAVAEGAVHLNPVLGALWRLKHDAIARARRSALRPLLRAPARWLRKIGAP